MHDLRKCTEDNLRAAGDVWADHILENAKAHIMSFVYIAVTVTLGHPLIAGIAYAAGLRNDRSPGDRLFYLLRFCDVFIYFLLPQINVFVVSTCTYQSPMPPRLKSHDNHALAAPLAPRAQFASPNGRAHCSYW